ncbi:MAG: methyl-accepting chemotaxis protein [Granulosicoccus sp.]|jgi:methyl-accepting chemotaxis protein
MKIKTKLIAGTLLLAFSSVGIVSVVANYIAQTNTNKAMTALAKDKLSSTLESKKSHVEQYLTNLRNQIRLMALEYNTDSANYHFSATFSEFIVAAGLKPEMKEAVIDYYKHNFLEPYAEKNTSEGVPPDDYFKGFTENHWLLHYHYIAANPNAVGEKYKMDAPLNEFSAFSAGHKGYHEVFRNYAAELGYGDIYFIDAEGTVTYSLQKGFELGTSVVDGPFADSGLARAFQAALKVKKGEIVVEDFSRYDPLYGAPAAFMASPLVKFRRVRGVFVVQLPIDVIDSIMTNEGQWEKVGLGETGENYLVGPDYSLRNTSRLYAEQPDNYFKKLGVFSNVNPQPVDDIIASGTNIGLQKVVTPSTKAALAGGSGYQIYESYDGRKVLSAYSPINVEGFDWAIVSEIDHDEAFQSAKALSQQLNSSLAIISVVVMLVAIVVVLLLANIIFKPLNMITQRMNEIATGNGSLKSRLDESGDNEISEFATSFNLFISKLDYIVDQVAQTSSLLLSQSSDLLDLSKQGKSQSLQQKDTIQNVVESIHQITSNIDQNNEYADLTSEAAVEANNKANAGKKATDQAVISIESIANEVNATSIALKGLEDDSKDIAAVLSIIDDISNQTNLLALNAAIEAARAGENGRGFAVVADEVRSLSHRIQTETHSIAETINKLQAGTGDAVATMKRSVEKSKTGVELASEAGTILELVVDSSSQINQMNEKIATATQKQKVIIHNINENIESASEVTEKTLESSLAIDGIGSKISGLAEELQGLVSQFAQDDVSVDEEDIEEMKTE